MKKLKILTVVGTRPEVIRLSRTIAELEKYCDHILVHTGQNFDYELNQIFFNDLQIKKPDYFLDSGLNSKSPSITIGNIIVAIDKLLDCIKPDAMLVLGDTNSCLSVIPAKRRKIPIFHMEAGNRCFDMRVPEEINRRIVDHTSDINLTYSSIAREYLLREGIPPDRIIKIGSPMLEVLSYYRPYIESSVILKKLDLKEHDYYLVSTHREENIESEESFSKLVDIINSVAELSNKNVIVSTHPRTQKRIDSFGARFNPKVRLYKPFGYFDYAKLQISAKAVLSDSGTINEESSILNFPALNLRDVHERPEAMEETAVMLVGLNIDRVIQGLNILDSQSRDAKRDLQLVADYNVSNVSKKVLRIIYSHIDYINQAVWKSFE